MSELRRIGWSLLFATPVPVILFIEDKLSVVRLMLIFAIIVCFTCAYGHHVSTTSD